MLKNILLKGSLSFKERFKNLLFYLSRKRGAKKMWDKRHQKVINANSNYINSIDKSIEKEHEKLWSSFRQNVDLTTFRICSNISGIQDPRLVPEDIFVSDIEPSLVVDSSVHYLSNKSFYNRWFKSGIFPNDILHCIEGRYLNNNLIEIEFSEFIKIARNQTYPLVLKPNRNSYGGAGVNFIKESDELISLAKEKDNFVVQEQIRQHPFFNKFNPKGLNTIRAYVYRSVTDNQLHILTMALRMGKDGSLDNETAGGIHSRIRLDGTLNGYAVDKYGTKYNSHPNTGFKFNEEIPDYEGLKNLVLYVGSQVFLSRIIGLDACLDDTGRWRIIEINTGGAATRFAQYGGIPFFGDHTNEVIAYCIQNHWTLI